MADDAQKMVDMVRATHDKISGVAPDGREYRASDPHLLSWIHAAEADSFLSAYQRYGPHRLSPQEADEYVAQSGRVALALGATNVPQTTAELAACIDGYRPELEASAAALDTAKFLLKEPPLPWVARGPYKMIAAGAIALMPAWANEELGIGNHFTRAVGGVSGAVSTRAVRWALGSAEEAGERVRQGSTA
jgi:uncharacterized protein (DUF2236 family)